MDDKVLNLPDGEFPSPDKTWAEVTKVVTGTPPTQGEKDKLLATAIPRDIASAFPTLRQLHLWGMEKLDDATAATLPATLETLDLRNCRNLTTLPPLPATLETLDLGDCARFSTLPALPAKLKELYLNDTALTTLPELPKTLEVLDLTNTQLKSIPATLLDAKQYPKLRDLRVPAGVEIGGQAVPVDRLRELSGKNALPFLKDWLKSGEQGWDKTPFVKVFLLGNGRAGKTQVCRLLDGRPLEKQWDSTHGAQLSFLEPGGGRVGLPEIGVTIWDFGGQDIYHGTHALFTDSRAVYIVVWTQKDRPDPDSKKQSVQYWLDYVSAISRDEHAGEKKVRVVVAESECVGKSDPFAANPGLKIPDNLECTIVGYDLKPGGKAAPEETGRELLEKIRPLIVAKSKDTGESVGKGWAALRDWLRTAELTEEERIVDAWKFTEWCERFEVKGEKQIEEVRKYLHLTGTIFHKQEMFGGQIVIDQQWALGAIYTIFDRSKAKFLRGKDRDGSFTTGEIREKIWGSEISQKEADTLISMMVACKICFPWGEKDGEPAWRAPELLPATRREVETNAIDVVVENYPVAYQHTFEFELLHDGILRGVMSTVGGEAGKSAFYWRTGFFAAAEKRVVYVMVSENKQQTGAAGTISVKVFANEANEAAGIWNKVCDILNAQHPKAKVDGMKKAVEDRSLELEAGSDRLGEQRWRFEVEQTGELDDEDKMTVAVTTISPGMKAGAPPQQEPKVFKLPPTKFIRGLTNYASGKHPAPAEFEATCSRFGEELMRAFIDLGPTQAMKTCTTWAEAMAEPKSERVTFQFSGEPDFHSIPWELMQTQEGVYPALKYLFRRSGKSKDGNVAREPGAARLKVLWVTARPQLPTGVPDTIPVGCVHDHVKAAIGADVEIEHLKDGTFQSLADELKKNEYHVVHLDLHADLMSYELVKLLGEAKRAETQERGGGLGVFEKFPGKKAVLRFSDGTAEQKIVPVTANELGKKLAKNGAAPIVALNACRAAEVPDENVPALPYYLLDAGAAGVVAFQGVVSVAAARIFFAEFYKTLSPSWTGDKVLTGCVDFAVREGRKELEENAARGATVPLKDWFLPVYYATHDVVLFKTK